MILSFFTTLLANTFPFLVPLLQNLFHFLTKSMADLGSLMFTSEEEEVADEPAPDDLFIDYDISPVERFIKYHKGNDIHRFYFTFTFFVFLFCFFVFLFDLPFLLSCFLSSILVFVGFFMYSFKSDKI